MRDGWTRVAFGDVVRQVKDRVDPGTSGLERYVAGEHMDTDDLQIRRWGRIGEGYLGPAFHMRFKPGQVLYGSRRTYLRKVALADFEGVTANTTFVVESKDPQVLLPGLVPYLMSTGRFHQHAARESRGSVNPYINFSDLAGFDFALPPFREQERLATLLLTVKDALGAYETVRDSVDRATQACLSSLRDQVDAAPTRTIADLCEPTRPLCYGVVQPGPSDPSGVPLIRVCDIEASAIDTSSLSRITRNVDEQFARSRVTTGDVLVSVVGTIGRVHLVREGEAGMNIARAIARIAPVDDLLPAFLASYLQLPHMEGRLNAAAFETARKTLNLEMLARERIPVPDRELQHQWIALSERATSTVLIAEDRSRALRSLSRLVVDQEFAPL